MIGTRLGSYEIRAEIGRGGMAVVYRAYQASVDREVAVKVILKSIASHAEAVQRFQREAHLVARLEHPHILPIYDFDGGHEPPYIVMRFLDGGTLKEVMQQGRLPLGEVGYLIQQVGSALDYAHRQGIVHRDVKPSNIMIDRDGNAFVTDFGIARMAGLSDQRHLTASGSIIGTPDYMSPEQARGENDIDARSDIYALGVILFEMLTGELPFRADTPLGVIMKKLSEHPPCVSEVDASLPPGLDAVVERALARDRAARYPVMSEFVEAVTGELQIVASSPSQLRSAAQNSVRLKASDQTGSPTPSGEQHKSVTALYVNAAEYAEIVDDAHGAESSRKAMEALWSECERIVNDKNGKIFERTDREMLALWGGITSREDDCENAVRAALDIFDILRKLGMLILVEGDPLPVKIGIHTGMALISPGKTGTGSASGTTISVANRLMQQSEGEILITHESYKLVRGLFDVSENVPLKLRGRDALAVYSVERAKARSLRMNTRGVEGVETKMIGRESEFKSLQNALLDALEDRETHAITVVSEAGLGKSRLIYELDNFVELRPEIFFIFRGQATPEMTNRPYALVRDLISFRFEIVDNDPPAVIRKKLEDGLRTLVGDEPEMAHMLGHLSGFDLSDSPHIRGLLGDPQQLNNRARQLFIRFIVKLCARGPAVMYIEDLHHADGVSLDLLSALISEHDDLPLLVVFTARPGFFEKRPSWASGQRNHQRIDLRPLDKRDSRSLAQEILQKVSEQPKALRDLLVERAEGNPFYMEELVKMLMDNRVILAESAEAWRVEESRIGHLNLPPTLVGLLQSRLDSLLYPERLTLQRAAVIGLVFYDTALLALDAADETHITELPGVLRRLTQRGFIQPRESSTFEGSVEYTFNGIMLREALLATLVSRQTSAWHTAAAGWLIEVGGKRAVEYSALIAGHFEAAGSLERAADYLTQAGSRAFSLCAFAEARTNFEHALSLLPPEHQAVLHLLVRIGSACYQMSDHSAARQALTTALQSARQQQRPVDLAEAQYWLSQIAARVEGNYTEARKYLTESLELVRQHQPGSALEALILYGLGDVSWRLSDLETARAYCQPGLELARHLGDVNSELLLLNRLGTTYVAKDTLNLSRQMYQEVYQKAMAAGNRERAASALNNLGVIAFEEHDVEESYRYALDTLAIAREIENRSMELLVLVNLADASNDLGKVAESRRYMREALALNKQVGEIPMFLGIIQFAGGLLLGADPQHARGWALLGLALYHPAADENIRHQMELLCDKFKVDPHDPQNVALMEVGKSLSLDETVDALLKEPDEG